MAKFGTGVRAHGSLREHITQMAARMMALDGVSDHGLAKRKAAERCGHPDWRDLPSNEEIDEALRTYQTLYLGAEHLNLVHRLRTLASQLMRLFAEFRPWLVGSVLSGTAGPNSDINLLLDVNNSKELELFLLNERIPFNPVQRHIRLGHEELILNGYQFVVDDSTPVQLLLLEDPRLRQHIGAIWGEKAKLAQLESLLAATAVSTPS